MPLAASVMGVAAVGLVAASLYRQDAPAPQMAVAASPIQLVNSTERCVRSPRLRPIRCANISSPTRACPAAGRCRPACSTSAPFPTRARAALDEVVPRHARALRAARAGSGVAEHPTDPLSWLGRISTAGQRLNYVGTFVYQSGGHVETSRIAHRVDAAGEHERLEVLDGSPREIIRRGAEVRCVLPDERTVIIDEAQGGGPSRRACRCRRPGWPRTTASARARWAGWPGWRPRPWCSSPRTILRYGHVLWADMQSGLLLKSRTLDQHGGVIEQFSFSEVRIGGEVDDALLESRFETGEGWRMVNARGSNMPVEAAGWVLEPAVPATRSPRS
jgi:hypothetical protein